MSELFPSSASSKPQEMVHETREEPPRYFYPFGNKRDPMVSLIGAGGAASNAESGGKGINKGEFSNLELKGIIHDGRGKVAMIASSDGESYLLRSGRIYDRKNRIVSGVSGIIKEKSVVLVSRNRTVTELSLRSREDGAISVHSPSAAPQNSNPQ